MPARVVLEMKCLLSIGFRVFFNRGGAEAQIESILRLCVSAVRLLILDPIRTSSGTPP